MRTHLTLIGLVILVVALLGATPGPPRRQVMPATLIPVADGQQLTVTTSAVSTLTVPTGARICHIQAYDGNLRYRDDGTDPTTSTGVCIFAGGDIWYAGDLDNLGLIAESGTVEVNVLYYQ